jgi:NOL1/NOP2/fmu family ribosome biogenesis protein
VLKRKGDEQDGSGSKLSSQKSLSGKEIKEFWDFAEETITDKQMFDEGVYLKFGEQLYLAPAEVPNLQGLKVLRPGLHLGTIKKNRFEPSHALALTLKKEQVCRTVNLGMDSIEIKHYLSGQTLTASDLQDKGWCLVLAEGYSVGWGKMAGGIVKNHYPKGLRKYL